MTTKKYYSEHGPGIFSTVRTVALLVQCCVCLSSVVRNVLWLNGVS